MRIDNRLKSDVFVQTDAAEWETVADGVDRQILGFDDGIMMVRVRFRQGSIGSVHRHMHRQVSYVEAGKFEVCIGKRTSVLGAGDCFIVPPDTDHGAVALSDGSLVDVFSPAREDFLE